MSLPLGLFLVKVLLSDPESLRQKRMTPTVNKASIRAAERGVGGGGGGK